MVVQKINEIEGEKFINLFMRFKDANVIAEWIKFGVANTANLDANDKCRYLNFSDSILQTVSLEEESQDA